MKIKHVLHMPEKNEYFVEMMETRYGKLRWYIFWKEITYPEYCYEKLAGAKDW